MELEARLMVNKKLQQQLQGPDWKKLSAFRKIQYRQGAIQRSLARFRSPKTDLLDKLIGINIGQDVGGLLKNLFRPPAQKSRKND